MTTFAYGLLPDELKRELCVQLLTEFGADKIVETTKGELRHRCTVPLAGHTDHDSVTASLNYRKLTFNCFVCQNAGGILWWIAVNRKETTEESHAWLQKNSGIGDVLDKDLFLRLLDQLFNPPRVEAAPMPTYGEQTLAQWSHERWGMFHPYLTEPWEPNNQGGREIPEKTLHQYSIGYCDEDHDWRYYQRIIIPLYWKGKLVGWQARKLSIDEDPDPTKYKNSPEAPRDRILYGDLDQRDLIVVESPMSVLRHSHHLPIVATLGANVTDMQVQLMHHYRRVILWFDPDKGGWAALQGTKNSPGLIARLKNYVELAVVPNTWAKTDPADLTEEEAEEEVERAVPFVLWKKPDPATLIPYRRSSRGVLH